MHEDDCMTFLYLHTVSPTVSSLSVVSSNNSFTLECTSTGSPATTVIWTKGGNLLSTDLTYQILRDGVAATYDSYIEIDADLSDLPGTYSCSVLNSAGLSNAATMTIQGKPIWTIVCLLV